ncbi:unnamed protein product [Blepharisma stoltei]|uniref:Calcium uniporter protein C-terminal domain-containing protein n=1 Tax=Blepharisma stoltei TaxID=1481888 RepID=A0AAU9JF29_9CILI|nr:unnamed protein product [Blepharisma stoltei]
MLRRSLRLFSSLELTPTFPPRLQLALSSQAQEFVLESHKTVGDLIQEIKLGDNAIKSVKLLFSDKEAPQSLTLGEITKKPFNISIDNKSYHVYPGIGQFIRGKEEFLGLCKEAGISFNDARIISKYLERLTNSLPNQFTYSDLQAAAASAIEEDKAARESDIEILKSQIASMEIELEPLEKKLKEIEEISHHYAKLVIYGGLTTLIAQWGIIGYGTFILYGWDVMEPVSYVVGASWMFLGYMFFMKNKEGFKITSFTDMLFKRKFNKLVSSGHLDLKRIEILKKSISLVNQQIDLLKP